MHATASAPARSTTSMVISMGLVSIPVSVYSATAETRVARKEFTTDGHSVGRQMYDKETGAVVDYRDIKKMVELDDGTKVELRDDEIAAATGHESGVAPIIGYMELDELHSQFITSDVYQLRPKRDKKVQTASDRGFTLLMRTLGAKNRAAVVRVSIRGSIAKWGMICPDGTLRIVHSIDQVREQLPMPSTEITDAELELASQLIDTIGEVDTASMVDDSAAKIAAFVLEKAKTDGVGEPMAVPTPVPVTDVLEQLLASIQAKKTAAA